MLYKQVRFLGLKQGKFIILQVSVMFSWSVVITYLCQGFSDGTLASARDRDNTQGGACSSDPPLRLTVSVSPSELLLRFHNKVIL